MYQTWLFIDTVYPTNSRIYWSKGTRPCLGTGTPSNLSGMPLAARFLSGWLLWILADPEPDRMHRHGLQDTLQESHHLQSGCSSRIRSSPTDPRSEAGCAIAPQQSGRVVTVRIQVNGGWHNDFVYRNTKIETGVARDGMDDLAHVCTCPFLVGGLEHEFYFPIY